MGHLAKPAFAIAFEKKLLIDVKFYFYYCNIAERVTNWGKLGSTNALLPGLQKYTAIPAFRQTTDELSIFGELQQLGVSNNNWTNWFQVFVYWNYSFWT